MKKTFSKKEIPRIATEIIDSLKNGGGATIVALSGDLGAGKTTLTQAIACELGVKENVISPTFIIMKSYDLPPAQKSLIGARAHSRLIHIDAYRLESHTELEKLGWDELIVDPKNLIFVEWPERVAEIIPATAHKISLAHKNDEEREIEFG